MTTTAVEELPRWDLSGLYAGLDSPEYAADFAKLSAAIDSLRAFLDLHNIRRMPTPPAASNAVLGQAAAQIIQRLDDAALLEDKLGAFTHALMTTNSYDTAAARETSRLEVLGSERSKLSIRVHGWLGSLSSEQLDALCKESALTGHAFFLRDSARQSKYLMAEELENLAADLCLDAGTAWGKLQGTVTSQLKVPFARHGEIELLPITVVQNLRFDSDADTRRRAYDAEIKGWESIRTTVAACLNGVKGTAITLAKRRGRASVLGAALDANKISRPTLDAMMSAIREHFPTFRRYLNAKALKLDYPKGKKLAWCDIFAPLGKAHAHFTWTAARDFIVEKFGSFSTEMAEFAALAFDGRWIDAGPRDGKRGGAYCMPVMSLDQSRIMANFDGSFEQLSTLAHELGHGFHDHCQSGLEPLRRGAPSTLAETASIFCETLVADAALKTATPDERLMILEAQLINATQVCLDISSRFLFESRVMSGRAESELSADQLCTLMTDAQAETYGDGLDAATYHPYMWLWKPHYYSHDHNFYNFPYAFGHLFSLGLFAIFRHEGAAFVPRYSELLRATGQDYAAPLAARFGLDITQPAFWRGSLQIVAEMVEQYEKS